jgi:hypothetical protein
MKERTSAQIIDDHGEIFAGMPSGTRPQTKGYSKGFIMTYNADGTLKSIALRKNAKGSKSWRSTMNW